MKYKKSFIFICLIVCLFSIASISAGDVNDTAVASEDTGQIDLSAVNEMDADNFKISEDTGQFDLSAGNEMDADNLTTSEENTTLTQTKNDESVSRGIDSEIISANPGLYSHLALEISKGGNIELEHDYYTYDSGSTITITGDNRVIDGNGAVIDMAGPTNVRVFYVNASGVTIKNLIIKNTVNNHNGGAIYFSSSGTLINCNFVDIESTAAKEGGAVYFEGCGSVLNCNFTNNQANRGGAVYFWDSGEVTNCNFINNSGGAVYFYHGDGNVSHCNFTGNAAYNFGGAVCFYYGNGTVTNCNFTGHKVSSGDGGAVEFKRGTGTVINCNFVNNRATGLGGAILMSSGSVSNCNFVNNRATGLGGAVYFRSTGSVSNCNFSDNKVVDTSSGGGAVYFEDTGNVSNCNFVNNTANEKGGAVYFSGTGSVINCNFAGSTAKYGGAVYFEDTGNVINCNFINSSKGAVYFNQGNGTISNCNFTNSINGMGGAVYFYQGTGSVSNCNFINSTASNRGGAVYFRSTGSVINCNFIGNSATYDGSAVYFSSAGTVTNCNFIANSGSAVYFYQGTGNVTNCNFIANSGSAVYFPGTGNVTNCNFTGNTANSGSAVYFPGTGSVSNCNFADNKATGDSSGGGAVYFSGKGTVTNCNFTGNTATGTLSYSGGGAVYFQNSGEVINCNFTDNTANLKGGAVYFRNSGEVINCNFADNKATGDSSSGGAVNFNGNGEMRYCNFTNNSATYDGGAVCFSGTGNVTNCNFINNTARNNGGAVCFMEGYSEVRYCNFINNTARNNGGAVYFYITGEVTNCNFIGNNASTGSAMYLYKYRTKNTFIISNSIFLNNRANVNVNVPFNVNKDGNNIIITFMGQNNFINAIYCSDDIVTFSNVTYWGATGITNTGIYTSKLSRSNNEAGQNITIRGVISGKIIETTKITNENGTVVIEDAGDYWIIVSHKEDSYYTEVGETIFTNMNLYANVTSKTTTNKTVNITAKSNVYSEVMPGKLLFILPNSTQIPATYGANGTWWAEHTFNAYSEYKVNATYVGLDNVNINNGTITINKVNSTITLDNIVLNYGDSRNVNVTTTGATGITAKIGENEAKVDEFVISLPSLDAGTYTLTVTTLTDDDHNPVTKTVNITVNKAYTEITLTNETLYLKAGDVVGDLANLTPADAGDLTFLSSNNDIAFVYDGTIYAQIKGNVTVTVSFKGNDNYLAAENKTITVYIIPKNAKVSVENETLDLNVDDKYEFNPTVNPSFLAVEYSSSNESVVVVTDYGLLRAVGGGTAIVTLTVGNDMTYAINTTNVTVTVSKVPTEISVAAATLDLNSLQEFAAGATLTPDAGNLTYTSSNESVAIVENGKIKALVEGTTIITVSFAGDNKYAAAENKTILVNVTPADLNLNASYVVSVLDDGFKIKFTVLSDPVINGNLTVKFNGNDYSVEMVNGTAEFTSDKVYSATYPTDILYESSPYYKNSTAHVDAVIKDTRVSRNNKFEYYYYNNDMGSDSQKGISQIKVVDIDGKPINNGLVTITIMNKYKLKVRTDANGVAKFTKAYKPGTYSVTATHNNKVTSLGNLVLKSVLNVPKVTTVKKSAKTTNMKITLKGTGPIKGKTVVVSFMKKNYKVTTDKNGVAIFKVTQDMVSKLASGKTYTVRVTYRMDSVAQSIKIAK